MTNEEIIKQCEKILQYLELKNEQEYPETCTLEYRIPPTPANALRNRAEELKEEADYIEKRDKDIEEFKDFISKLKEE